MVVLDSENIILNGNNVEDPRINDTQKGAEINDKVLRVSKNSSQELEKSREAPQTSRNILKNDQIFKKRPSTAKKVHSGNMNSPRSQCSASFASRTPRFKEPKNDHPTLDFVTPRNSATSLRSSIKYVDGSSCFKSTTPRFALNNPSKNTPPSTHYQSLSLLENSISKPKGVPASSSFRASSKRFAEKKDEHPDPGAYQNLNNLSSFNQKKQTPSVKKVGFGSSDSRLKIHGKNSNPGPGAYHSTTLSPLYDAAKSRMKRQK